MLRLAALALVTGGLAAAVFLVPVHGRTVADRWEAAPGAGAFFGSAWRELRGVPAEPRERRHPQRPREPARVAAKTPARPAPTPAPAAPAETPAGRRTVPAEHHTSSDRAALDRLLTERAR
jgi:hypothetical protein